ncbi:MAG TPA: YdeI/OmpD-associated family protein, partial [Ktedonobacterales bacterium]|nr:YdeI/OmpD-associated family protein [Ktedonobacterales bacterium]
LIAAGRMQAAGLRQVEAAQADGRWDAAYASQRAIEVPPDFQAELDAHPTAQAFFAGLNSANRYAFLWRIHTAKKPETRAKRIAQFIEMLERGEKLHP